MTRTASWIIRHKATGRVICETFSARTVAALSDHYEAVPIADYLGSINTPEKRGEAPSLRDALTASLAQEGEAA